MNRVKEYRPPSTVIHPFQQNVVNVFKTMTGHAVQVEEIQQESWLWRADVISTLSVTGNLSGTAMLGMPRPLAVQVVRAILGKDTVSEAQIQDGISELLNIIVGKTTGPLENTPYCFTFDSPPSVPEQRDDLSFDPENDDVWVLPFTICDQTFVLELHLAYEPQ